MPSTPNRDLVKSDETLLSILRVLKDGKPMTLSEIADEVELANSTVYEHLATMEENGFIYKSGKTYRLGLRFLDYGMAAVNQRKVYCAAKGRLDELAEELNETALLITEEQGQAVYLYRAKSPQSFRAQIDIGQHTSLHHLAAGKAILSHLPEERVDEIIDEASLKQFTDKTVVDRDALESRFETIRERGYALNLEESIQGLNAVSAPIEGSQTRIEGAVSISGPAHRLTEERIESEVANEVLSVANQIELSIRTDEGISLSQ